MVSVDYNHAIPAAVSIYRKGACSSSFWMYDITCAALPDGCTMPPRCPVAIEWGDGRPDSLMGH